MTDRVRKIALVCVLVLAGGALAWSLRDYLTGQGGAEPEFMQAVLCSSCGHLGEMKLSEVDLGARKNFSPAYGPGMVCPQCKKQTLYANPVVCEKCSTSFLIERSPAGAAVVKCPKCAWTR